MTYRETLGSISLRSTDFEGAVAEAKKTLAGGFEMYPDANVVLVVNQDGLAVSRFGIKKAKAVDPT